MNKLKFTFALWCCVYPFISVLSLCIKMLLPNAPHFVFTFIVSAIFVPIMVYLIVPFVTRILQKV